jgi:hypothetical protein
MVEAAYAIVSAHLAVVVHVPLPAVIVIVDSYVPDPELVTVPAVQTPVAVIVGVLAYVPLSFDVAVTVNVDPSTAVAGAPLKPVVGVIRSAVVFCVAFTAGYSIVAAHFAVVVHAPLPSVIVIVDS